MDTGSLAVLYSFRRCPYAIRARLALYYAGIDVVLREVVLSDKPQAMRDVSAKATVPVLVLNEGGPDQQVLDESLDIIDWALAQHDPDGWLQIDRADAKQLIAANDKEFKPWLDRFKYPQYFPAVQPGEASEHCDKFLQELERRLGLHGFLCGHKASVADFSVFPFVRQFAMVDYASFESGPYAAVKLWLQQLLNSALFAAIMHKYPQWQPGDPVTVFGPAGG